MTMSNSRIIYAAAGAPIHEVDGNESGMCAICGIDGVGIPFDDWLKDTFTDLDKLVHGGAIACHACQFCSHNQSAYLAKQTGKDKPQKFRNYSHIVYNGVWYPLSKGQKSAMRDLLVQSPEVVLIATSGQKHTFYRSVPGRWQVEEQSMLPDVPMLRMLLDIVTPMLQVFSKTELETARYDHRRIIMYGVDAWRQAEQVLRVYRGTLIYELVLFLAQKEDTE